VAQFLSLVASVNTKADQMGKAKTITNLITGEVFYDNLHNKALSQVS
jgi:hypothetical protein